MQANLGVYVESTGAANAATTRHATYLYGLQPSADEHTKRLVWTVSETNPCIDDIEPGAFNDLTELEYIDVDSSSLRAYGKFILSYCGLLWKPVANKIELICCPQKFFQAGNVDLPGVPNFIHTLAVGDYGFYNVAFRNTAPIMTNNGMQQLSFSCSELPRVAELGDCALANTNLTHFTIWPELTSIGMYSFMNCNSLKKVDCLQTSNSFGLSKIASGTFYNCVALEEVVLPEGIVYIGSNAFANCKQLKKVHLPASLSCICRDAFKECGDVELVVPPQSKLKHIGIAEYVYLAGEPNLKIKGSRTQDVQLEYYRNNYAIQNVLDISSVGGNIHFEKKTETMELPRAVQLLQRR